MLLAIAGRAQRAGNGPLQEAWALLVAPGIDGHHVYVCGPDAWTAAVLRAARELGVPPARLHRERFAW